MIAKNEQSILVTLSTYKQEQKNEKHRRLLIYSIYPCNQHILFVVCLLIPMGSFDYLRYPNSNFISHGSQKKKLALKIKKCFQGQ